MLDEPAYTVRRHRRLQFHRPSGYDLDAALRAAGLARVAERATTTVGLGVVHRTWAATPDEWAELFRRHAPDDLGMTGVLAAVTHQAAWNRRGLPERAVERVADDLAVPAALVLHLLGTSASSCRSLTDKRWPTLAGLAAVRREVLDALPADVLRVDPAELATLRAADPGAELVEEVTGAAPGGSRCIRIAKPERIATRLLLHAATAPGRAALADAAPARLAVRLQAISEWQRATDLRH